MDPSSMMNNPMVQQMMRDPEVMALLQKPGILQKLQQAMANPANMMSLMQDPDLMTIMSKLQGSMMGHNAPAQQQQQQQAQGAMDESLLVKIKNEAHMRSIIDENPNKLIVVDFFATWCGPCKRIAPAFARLSSMYKKTAIFCKVDGDQCKDVCSERKVNSYPTFHFYLDGSLVHSFSGADEHQLTEYVGRLVQDLTREPESPYKHIPLKWEERVIHTKCKFTAVGKSVVKNNTLLQEAKSEHALSASENVLVTQVHDVLGNLKNYHTTTITTEQKQVLNKMLRWPVANMAPTLHTFRVLMTHPQGADYVSAFSRAVIDKFLQVVADAPKPTIALVALWALANMFHRRALLKNIVAHHESVMDILEPLVEHKDAKVRAAFVGILVNFAIHFRNEAQKKNISSTHEEEKVRCLSTISEWITQEPSKSIVYQLLVVLGTLVYRDSASQDIAQGLEVSEAIEAVIKKFYGDSKIEECGKEIVEEIKKHD